MSASTNQQFCDRGLNTAEQCAVNVSLRQIQLNEDFDSVSFWGKIFAIERDYIIASATKITNQVEQKFFYSDDGGLSFSQLPIVEPWMEAKCLRIASRFTGTTSQIYDDKPPKNGDDEDEEEEEEEKTLDEDAENADPNAGDEPPAPVYKLTELDRLAWTVSNINQECLLVPKGGIWLNSSKHMHVNPHFTGLSRSDANRVDSYLHWRTPQSAVAISNYRKIGAINNSSFLDSIVDDLPKGCWQLRSVNAGLLVSIQNLLWPGFEFKYETGNTRYEQGYFGYGVRQNDLLFLM